MFSVDMSTREFAGHGVISLRGDLDVTGAPGVTSHLITAAAVYGSWVIVDLTGLDFIDAAGLGVLVRASARARRNGGELLLAAPQELVRRVLAAAGLMDVLPVYPSVEEAIRGVEKGQPRLPAA
jgi:anti-sigma B factor antagonist